MRRLLLTVIARLDERLAHLIANPFKFLPFNGTAHPLLDISALKISTFAYISWTEDLSRSTGMISHSLLDPAYASLTRGFIYPKFAYNEASFFLIRLLQTFDSITLRPDAQPTGSLPNSSGTWDLSQGRNGREKVWPRTHLTMYVEGGMWVVMGESSQTSVDTGEL